mmetsp:Transcript_15758/g.59973  ORF Transcript_15758/g.59973 Transcript_15758/m.59973 type:complete len:212 (+) Transcript_15758:166-801(+)
MLHLTQHENEMRRRKLERPGFNFPLFVLDVIRKGDREATTGSFLKRRLAQVGTRRAPERIPLVAIATGAAGRFRSIRVHYNCLGLVSSTARAALTRSPATTSPRAAATCGLFPRRQGRIVQQLVLVHELVVVAVHIPRDHTQRLRPGVHLLGKTHGRLGADAPVGLVRAKRAVRLLHLLEARHEERHLGRAGVGHRPQLHLSARPELGQHI